MTPRIALPVLVLAALGLTGCAPGLEAPRYTTCLIETDDPDRVLQAAEVVLRREFGRLTVDREQRRIESDPREYTSARDSGTARDLVGARSRMRRVASFAVVRRGSGMLARLRVDLERQDTAQRAASPPDAYRLSDSPAYTPIERDAATTRRQNTVWTKVRRDQRLERALLDELRELFAPEASVETAEQPTTDQTTTGRE
jgi:hypothetical protein